MTSSHASVPEPAVSRERVRIEATDGTPLTGWWFQPRQPGRGAVVLHGATAAPQRFYRAFATALAEAGHPVLTYDYRGVGESRPATMRGYRATMSDWALLDAPAAVRYVLQRSGTTQYFVVGHSFGGQVSAALPKVPPPRAMVFVGVQRAWFAGGYRLRERILYGLAFRVLEPMVSAVFGYVPGWLGLGADLPSGVMRQWGAWCRTERYHLEDHPEFEQRLGDYAGPIYALTFSDDHMVPFGNARWMLQLHRGAAVLHQHARPEELDLVRVGHFGFFRASHRRLWPVVAEFFGRTMDHTLGAFSGLPSIPWVDRPSLATDKTM